MRSLFWISRGATTALILGALTIGTVSAQEVSGRITGPGVDVISGASADSEATLGVQARQLPRTGGLVLDPMLGVFGALGLSSLGLFVRRRRPPSR
jgi:hypothetical protein